MSLGKEEDMLSVCSALLPGYAPVCRDPVLKTRPILFARFSGP